MICMLLKLLSSLRVAIASAVQDLWMYTKASAVTGESIFGDYLMAKTDVTRTQDAL